MEPEEDGVVLLDEPMGRDEGQLQRTARAHMGLSVELGELN